MTDRVEVHYSGNGNLSDVILESLQKAGKNVNEIKTTDLAAVDEFHIRGRKATLELAGKMNLNEDSHVLDIGCGLGGPARTIAETYGCHVTGVDLTSAFCEAARVMSEWVNLGEKLEFRKADAVNLPFAEHTFDAVMTIHVGMNIQNKAMMYEQARRVLKSSGIFAVYDVLEGGGGGVLFPVPWAREASISHLATTEEMVSLLSDTGFTILEIQDSTEESQYWFEEMTARMAQLGPPPVTFRAIFGDDFVEMARNQVQNLSERRIRTVSYICQV